MEQRELPHHSAGVIVYREGVATREREYLLLLSALTRRPMWEFAKGTVEPGEDDRAAALRELREETGLGVDDIEVLEGFVAEERYVFSAGSGPHRRRIRKRVVYLLARWRRGQVRISREALEHTWADAARARRLVRFPAKRRVLDAAEQWLEDGGDATAER